MTFNCSTGHSMGTGVGVVIRGGVGVVMRGGGCVILWDRGGVVLYSLEDIDHPEAGTGSDTRGRAISTAAEGALFRVDMTGHMSHLT